MSCLFVRLVFNGSNLKTTKDCVDRFVYYLSVCARTKIARVRLAVVVTLWMCLLLVIQTQTPRCERLSVSCSDVSPCV